MINESDNSELQNKIKQKKVELEEIYDNQIQGVILRSKARWVESGEKNTKYFAELEKRHFESRVIHRLKVNNKDIHNAKEILEEERKYYKQLYDKVESETSTHNFYPEDFEQKLTDDDSQKCEGAINENECVTALKSMKNNKSPGSDGITCEFYKIFWKTIGKYFINSINYSYEKGELNDLQKQSIISLIPKKDKELSNLSNWRPISLLNVDYKMATKVIANRIKKVLPNIIDPSQTGFIKGRYIGENIRLIWDVIEYTEDLDIPGILFFADFEKAFDSVNHTFMIDCLKFFNFGPSLIQWIKVFYNGALSCVTNNGFLSDFFPVKRGVRQGCPLSPYLFIICIELLSHAIRKDDNIKGIRMYEADVKNSHFADDTTFSSRNLEFVFFKLPIRNRTVLLSFNFKPEIFLNCSKT